MQAGGAVAKTRLKSSYLMRASMPLHRFFLHLHLKIFHI